VSRQLPPQQNERRENKDERSGIEGERDPEPYGESLAREREDGQCSGRPPTSGTRETPFRPKKSCRRTMPMFPTTAAAESAASIIANEGQAEA
jgi:hypothetical protein